MTTTARGTGARPMPPQDSLWLAVDSPANLLVITGVMWTAEPVDPDRLRAVVQERLVGRHPVFRQRPVLGSPRVSGLRSARWVDDPDFDLDRHLTVRRMPAPGTRAALERYVAEQRSRPFDPDHPRWSVELLQGYGGGSAVVQRYHHSMADGVRLTGVMLSVLDPLDRAAPAPALTGRRDGRIPDRVLTDPLGGLARGLGAGVVVDAATAAGSLLPARVRPGRALDTAAGAALALWHTAGSVVKIAGRSNPRTALSGEPGVAKTAVWADPVPLDLLREVAHETGTTVNDVCLALLAGAVRRHLVAAGTAADDVPDLAWMVPVNLVPLDRAPSAELGNHLALVLVVLPHGIADFGERLAEVHRRVARIRASFEAELTLAAAAGIARLPDHLSVVASRALAARAVGVLTNVPGPTRPMALAGARVDGIVGWAPCSGPQTVTVCIVSYAGQVTLGFGTDRGVVPRPRRLVAAFAAEVRALASARAAAGAAATGRSPS